MQINARITYARKWEQIHKVIQLKNLCNIPTSVCVPHSKLTINWQHVTACWRLHANYHTCICVLALCIVEVHLAKSIQQLWVHAEPPYLISWIHPCICTSIASLFIYTWMYVYLLQSWLEQYQWWRSKSCCWWYEILYQSADIKVSYSTVVNNVLWPHTYCTSCILVHLAICVATCILLTILKCMCTCYSLSNNSISVEGARAVADGMKYCTSLQTLQWVIVQQGRSTQSGRSGYGLTTFFPTDNFWEISTGCTHVMCIAHVYVNIAK